MVDPFPAPFIPTIYLTYFYRCGRIAGVDQRPLVPYLGMNIHISSRVLTHSQVPHAGETGGTMAANVSET